MVTKRPYFMRYLYSDYNKKYQKHVENFNVYCISKYGYDIDKAAFDEATQKLLTTYYDGAVKTIEEGDDMTNHTINFLKGKAFGFAENKDDRNSQLQFIVEVTEKQLAEDAEGGNN